MATIYTELVNAKAADPHKKGMALFVVDARLGQTYHIWARSPNEAMGHVAAAFGWMVRRYREGIVIEADLEGGVN